MGGEKTPHFAVPCEDSGEKTLWLGSCVRAAPSLEGAKAWLLIAATLWRKAAWLRGAPLLDSRVGHMVFLLFAMWELGISLCIKAIRKAPPPP